MPILRSIWSADDLYGGLRARLGQSSEAARPVIISLVIYPLKIRFYHVVIFKWFQTFTKMHIPDDV